MEQLGRPDPEYPEAERHPESNLVMLISNIGVLMDWPAAYTPNVGPMDAFILVQLKGKRGSPGTFETASRLRTRLGERFPGVQLAFDTGGMLTSALNMGEPAPIHVQVAGSSLEVSHSIAETVAREASRVPGAVDVRIAQPMDYPTLELDIDRVKAAYAGVSVNDVMKNLVTATNSSVNFDPAFWIDERNGNHYFIGAQYAEAELESLDTLRNVPITGGDGRSPVPLETVVDIERGTGPAVVNHRNITRVIDVYAGVAPGFDVGSVVSELERRLRRSEALSPVERVSDRGTYFEVAGPELAGRGYTYTMEGEVAVMRDALGQFTRGFGLAVVLIYLVMVVQFRSFADPFAVLLAVPLGGIGVAIMLASTGTPMSIMTAMGIIMMIGLVVAYGILLVDYANRRLAAGAGTEDAVLDAASVRLRPILMTSLAAVLALAPMAVGARGGEANAPLARTIIGGVLGAASLSLLVVPCLYTLIKRGAARLAEPDAEQGGRAG